jgi:hypothetical protein
MINNKITTVIFLHDIRGSTLINKPGDKLTDPQGLTLESAGGKSVQVNHVAVSK